MKAASSSEWYDTTPGHLLLPQIHQHPSTSSISSSSSLPRLHHHHQYHHHHHYPRHRGSFLGESSSSSHYDSHRHHEHPPSFTSAALASSSYSFSSSTGTNSSTSKNASSTTSQNPPKSINRPPRQISKVVTPTITPPSSTSFSKSYSRTSQSRSNSTTEPTVTTSQEGTSSERPPYSFSSEANKLHGRLSKLQQRQQQLFLGSSSQPSGSSFASGNQVLSSPLPPVISESEASEESEEEEDPTEETADEEYYDKEEESEDQIYQSFKQSLKMFRARPVSPAMSLQSVITEVDEDEEDVAPDTVDDEVTSCTEEETEEEETDRYSSIDSVRNRYMRSTTSVPKTPVKVRVKVEKAVPQTYFDDRVKVTVQVEEETEVSEVDEEEEEEEDEDEEEEEDSATESEVSTQSSVQTVRYLRRDNDHKQVAVRTEGESESGGESGSETLSEDSEGNITSDYYDNPRVLTPEITGSMDKTDYYSYSQKRAPMFPPINGVSPYKSQESSNIESFSSGSNLFGRSHSDHTDSIANRQLAMYSMSSGDTFSKSKRSASERSVDSATSNRSQDTTESKSVSSEQASGTGTGSGGSSAVTASSSDLSLRSHSARSSLLGRASAIHKMYSVGGKLRSLSARRTPSQFASQLHLSSDSHKTSSSSNIGSKQFLPDAHLGSLPIPSTSSPRSSSATSASKRFSAQLRQLSLGNLQAMNPSFPRPAAQILAEKVFRGEELPPITPPSPPSTSSTTSGSSGKPRPLLRNLTYTVCSHPSTEEPPSENNGLPKLPPQRSREHVMLRQLIMSDRTSSSASTSEKEESSLHDLLFPSNLIKTEEDGDDGKEKEKSNKPQAQVSFANQVIEHSLSSSHTLESTPSEQTGSSEEQQQQRSEQQTSSESGETDSVPDAGSGYYFCRLTGRRLKRLDSKQEEQLLNKEYLTFGELQQESIEEEMDAEEERLRHFALDRVRQQMEMERKRILSMTEEDDEIFSEDYEFSGEDSAASTENESEEEEEGEEEVTGEGTGEEGEDKPKEGSHIPVATSEVVPGEIPELESEGMGGEHIESHDTPAISNSDDAGSGSLQEHQGEPHVAVEEEYHYSPLPTRLNSAESGYRAMPPSRAETSRENSLDPEEAEKEKQRLLEQWKQTGGADHAINTSLNSTSSHMIIGGEIITINHSRPNTASSSRAKDSRIQNGIDLTQELPGEEKKIAAVWEEFNRDERDGGAMADYEFSTLLDEMIMDVNSYKPKLSTGPQNSNNSQSQSLQVSTTQATPSTSWEQPKFDPSRKYTTLAELIALLSHNLRLVSAETLEDHMASLISLISSVLRKVRKNKTDEDQVTQIACLSAIRVLCDRLQEMTNSQNLKYADLSWLFRVLCKYSSDSDSKIRPEASFCLARLVKVAGPALVVRPIYFILVMESEGGGGKSTTGAKTKASAIDTLTYAMLTFPKEDFHNLEEIAGWVCLAMLNEERRIRQSALECLAIISQHLGGRDKALPLFHNLFLKEELDHFSRSPSPEMSSKTGKSSKRSGKGSDPIPLSVHGTVRLLTGPGFPIAQPIDAITARLDKDVLPVPSTKGLIEYAVNVPTGKDLVLLMTHMLEKDDDEWDFSSSTDSLDSNGSAHSKRSSVTSLGFSDIDWTGEGPDKAKQENGDLISPDVAYILLGKGRVNKSDVVLLDTYKKEVIPEIIQMLNEKKGQGKGRRNRRRWGKNQKNKKKRRRKGRQRAKPNIPTLSFDAEEDTLPPNEDSDSDDDENKQHLDDDESVEVFDDPNSPVAVVVEPPPDESTATDT